MIGFSDAWIENNSPLDPASLHAMGAINAYWNQSELGMFLVLAELLGLKLDEVTASFGTLSGFAVESVVRTLSENRPSSLRSDQSALRADIQYAVRLFAANRKNRNLIVHATSAGGNAGDAILQRRAKKHWDFRDLPSDLSTLREIAEECRALSEFLSKVVHELMTLNMPGRKALRADMPKVDRVRPRIPEDRNPWKGNGGES